MIALLVALLSTEPPRAPTAVEGVTVIAHPVWVRMPNSNALGSHYPRHALSHGIAGHSTMECSATAQGALVDCQVIEETPKGEGFGDAMLGLARYYRMKPMTPDGKPIDGARVVIPIHWAIR